LELPEDDAIIFTAGGNFIGVPGNYELPFGDGHYTVTEEHDLYYKLSPIPGWYDQMVT